MKFLKFFFIILLIVFADSFCFVYVFLDLKINTPFYIDSK